VAGLKFLFLNEGMNAEVIVLVQESKLAKAEGLPIEEAIAKVQAMVRRHVPERQSLSEELIRERRAENERIESGLGLI
jgi:hypothetical protein